MVFRPTPTYDLFHNLAVPRSRVSLLDDVDKDGPSGERLPDLGIGKYRLKVIRIGEGVTFKQRMEYLKVTVEVMECQGPSANVPGSVAGLMIYKDPFGYYRAETRNLIAALIRESPDKIKPEMAKE